MPITKTPFFDALAADGPPTELASEMMLYGQFVGSWVVQVADYADDGTKTTGRGTWHFGWVLQGRAIQDVFIVPPGTTRPRYGTTIRVYDPANGVWHIRWHNPVNQAYNVLVARQVGPDIVQEGTADEGAPIRWTFTDITADSFRWLGQISRDDGRTWQTQADFFAQRVAS